MGGAQDARGVGPSSPGRTAPERREPGADAATAAPVEVALGPLLTGVLRPLAEATGSTCASAWALHSDGRVDVVAGAFSVPPTGEVADPEARQALMALRGCALASDLGNAPLSPSVAAWAKRIGAAAAVALPSAAGEPVAFLLIGGPEDVPGRVRPRTLARLQQAADRLREPIATASAIAELRRLGEEVRHLDRRAALGDLLSEVVHEIRNPLVAVKTFLQLAPTRLDDEEFRGAFRETVCDEVARLERLLDEVMGYARPEQAYVDDAPRYEPCDVGPSFASLTGLLAHRARERRVEIVTHVDDALPSLAIPEDRLRQILLNLTLNALDATAPGSRVMLSARVSSGRRGEVHLTVDDEGPGLAPELRERLFEPFYSTRAASPGGLGLAIARRLAEEAGGSLQVDDAPGGGARLALTLPAASA